MAIIFQVSQILKGALDAVTGDKIKGASKGQCFPAFFWRVVSLNTLLSARGQQVPGFLRSEVLLSVSDVSVLMFSTVTELPRSPHCIILPERWGAELQRAFRNRE